MAGGTVDAQPQVGYYCVCMCVMAAYLVFLSANCKLPTNVANCNDCVKKNILEPTCVYYRWKLLLELLVTFFSLYF